MNPTAIDAIIEAAFRNMGARFQNLNLREQKELRYMVFQALVASQAVSAAQEKDRPVSPEVMGELRGIRSLLEGLKGVSSRSGEAAISATVEDVERLTKFFLDKSTVKDNLDDVKIDSGQADDVSGTVDRLKRLQQGEK